MLSGLSIPTEDFKFSLPACVFSINIPIYRLNFKSASDVMGYIHNARPGLKPSTGKPKWVSNNYKVKTAG